MHLQTLLVAASIFCVSLPMGVATAQPVFDPPATPNPTASAVRGVQNLNTFTTSPATIAPAPAAAPVAKSYVGVSTTGGTANAQPLKSGEIIARIDGQIVLAGEVMWQVNKILDANAERIPPGERETISKQIMQQQLMGMIDTKLLYADFRRTVPPENIPSVEENLQKPFEEHEIPRLLELFEVETTKELTQELAKLGTTLAELQRQFNERTIASEWLRQKSPKPKEVTYDQLVEHYQEHVKLGEYDNEAKAQWEEMMVRFDQFDGDRNAAYRAMAEIGNEVWAHVVANPDLRGPAFTELAVKKSHGFTAKKGGQHDWTTKGALRSKQLDEALFSLEVGQMSNIIESDQGFHIVRVLKREEAGRTPFTKAQADIRKKLEAEQKNQLVRAEVERMRKACTIWTVFDGELTGPEVAELMSKPKRR